MEIFTCPFCGSIEGMKEARITFSDPLNDKNKLLFAITCTDCSASGPYAKTTKEAWNLWGKRYYDN